MLLNTVLPRIKKGFRPFPGIIKKMIDTFDVSLEREAMEGIIMDFRREVLGAVILQRWFATRCRMGYLNSDLISACRNTRILDTVYVDDFVKVFPSVCLMAPTDSDLDNHIWITTLSPKNMVLRCGDKDWKLKFSSCDRSLICFLFMYGDAFEVCGFSTDEHRTLQEVMTMIREKNGEIWSKYPKWEKEYFDKITLTLNTMLLWQQEPHYVTTEPAVRLCPATRKTVSVQDLVFGSEFRLKPEVKVRENGEVSGAGAGTHASPIGHWRRGHWHRYHHSERFQVSGTGVRELDQGVHLRWLKPMWIR